MCRCAKDRPVGAAAESQMIRRWSIYLAVLAGCLGLYGAYPRWITWMALLTAAGSPLISVAVSAILGEKDPLGLFHLPGKKRREYDQVLRPYRPGDSVSRVHWKQTAKSGELLVREERILEHPKRKRICGILPVAVCVCILFCLFPPGRYGVQMQRLFQKKPEIRFDLNAGPRKLSDQPILDVISSKTQLLYLRGQSYDVYDGDSWRASEKETWSVWDPEGEVTVAVRSAPELQVGTYAGAPPKDCLQLLKETKAWAKKLAEGKTVAEIQSFVRSCADYDENAAAEGDAAHWLVKNGRGYCVHFATTAAVLLRAAGIPARFVTGYVVSVQAGLRRTVTGQDAHAWVEYWDGESWRILEATPTVEASVLPPMQKENRQYGGWWVLLLAAVPLLFGKKENGRLKELQQKAAFSEFGLTPEEAAELERLRKTRI